MHAVRMSSFVQFLKEGLDGSPIRVFYAMDCFMLILVKSRITDQRDQRNQKDQRSQRNQRDLRNQRGQRDQRDQRDQTTWRKR